MAFLLYFLQFFDLPLPDGLTLNSVTDAAAAFLMHFVGRLYAALLGASVTVGGGPCSSLLGSLPPPLLPHQYRNALPNQKPRPLFRQQHLQPDQILPNLNAAKLRLCHQ